MSRVVVSARKLNWPPSCCCCLSQATTQMRLTATRTTGIKVIRTDKRAWDVPYCAACVAHVSRFHEWVPLVQEHDYLKSHPPQPPMPPRLPVHSNVGMVLLLVIAVVAGVITVTMTLFCAGLAMSGKGQLGFLCPMFILLVGGAFALG